VGGRPATVAATQQSFRDFESQDRMMVENSEFELPLGGTHIVVTTARPRRL
jgi:hypothetical protein